MDFIRFWLESEDECKAEGENSDRGSEQSDTNEVVGEDSSAEDEIENEIDGNEQDFCKIRAECLSSGTLFEDPDFPANDFSIYYTIPPPEGVEEIKWKRPKEIVQQPRFVTEGFSRFDVRQGALGDCWFIASCATLTSNPLLFERVVPQDNGQFDVGYTGAFRFRFWQYGRWVEVVIDDRLPVNDDGQLRYMSSSTEEEFWAALLEKAYAKLYGSYKALVGGTGCEGMEDLTGGITEFYDLKGAEPEDLFDIVERNLAQSSLVTAGIYGGNRDQLKQVTLRPNHAYSVTKVFRLDAEKDLIDIGLDVVGDVRLICVRNPWGSWEYTGPWSDHSIEWIMVNYDRMQELNIVREDGEFWMKFEDFLKYFDKISMCRLCPSLMSDEQKQCCPWQVVTYTGKWKRGRSAGGSDEQTFWKNPQYFIKLAKGPKEDSDGEDDRLIKLAVGLMQKHHRENDTMSLAVRLKIFPIPDTVVPSRRHLPKEFFDNVAPVDDDTYYDISRELVVRYALRPGKYVLVPHAWKPGQEGEFLLRIFAEGSLTDSYSSQPCS